MEDLWRVLSNGKWLYCSDAEDKLISFYCNPQTLKNHKIIHQKSCDCFKYQEKFLTNTKYHKICDKISEAGNAKCKLNSVFLYQQKLFYIFLLENSPYRLVNSFIELK